MSTAGVDGKEAGGSERTQRSWERPVSPVVLQSCGLGSWAASRPGLHPGSSSSVPVPPWTRPGPRPRPSLQSPRGRARLNKGGLPLHPTAGLAATQTGGHLGARLEQRSGQTLFQMCLIPDAPGRAEFPSELAVPTAAWARSPAGPRGRTSELGLGLCGEGGPGITGQRGLTPPPTPLARLGLPTAG